MKYVIELPETFSTEQAQTKIEDLGRAYSASFSPNTTEVVFDFSKCTTFSPTGLIYIRMWRDQLNENGIITFYRKANQKADSFFKRMRLIPRTETECLFERSPVEEEFLYDIHCCNTTQECTAAHKEILSRVVEKDSVPAETYAAVDYMLNELWDNAGVHGYECYLSEDYPKPIYICALEHEDHYEICVGDRGQGIYSSLKKNNKSLQEKNKKDSVKAAIQNGISGHPNGSPGFGLYCSAEFMRKGSGKLHIWSSGCYLVISAKDDRIYNSSITHGTIVSFIINKDAVLPFEKVLNAQVSYPVIAKEYIEEMIGGLFE